MDAPRPSGPVATISGRASKGKKRERPPVDPKLDWEKLLRVQFRTPSGVRTLPGRFSTEEKKTLHKWAEQCRGHAAQVDPEARVVVGLKRRRVIISMLFSEFKCWWWKDQPTFIPKSLHFGSDQYVKVLPCPLSRQVTFDGLTIKGIRCDDGAGIFQASDLPIGNYKGLTVVDPRNAIASGSRNEPSSAGNIKHADDSVDSLASNYDASDRKPCSDSNDTAAKQAASSLPDIKDVFSDLASWGGVGEKRTEILDKKFITRLIQEKREMASTDEKRAATGHEIMEFARTADGFSGCGCTIFDMMSESGVVWQNELTVQTLGHWVSSPTTFSIKTNALSRDLYLALVDPESIIGDSTTAHLGKGKTCTFTIRRVIVHPSHELMMTMVVSSITIDGAAMNLDANANASLSSNEPNSSKSVTHTSSKNSADGLVLSEPQLAKYRERLTPLFIFMCKMASRNLQTIVGCEANVGIVRMVDQEEDVIAMVGVPVSTGYTSKTSDGFCRHMFNGDYVDCDTFWICDCANDVRTRNSAHAVQGRWKAFAACKFQLRSFHGMVLCALFPNTFTESVGKQIADELKAMCKVLESGAERLKI